MLAVIGLSIIGGLLSLVGGVVLLWRADWAKKSIGPLLAFAAGAFLAVTFFELLPEAIEQRGDSHRTLATVLVGFSLFFYLERILMRYVHGRHPGHNHSEHTESLAVLVILGDTLHNFLDGVVIALSWLVSPQAGVVTTLAVAAHEIPQEIGEVAILINQGWRRSKILLVNVVSSLAAVVGAIVGFWGGVAFEPYIPVMLAGVAGAFLYIAASDIIPEIHHRAGHNQLARVGGPFVASIVLVWWLLSLAHV